MDPYRQWLEIREDRRPLSHYELLKLRRFETDLQLIQTAYGQQMTRARRYQVGAHMELAQRIVSELSEAFVCLTDPRRKEAYDALLRRDETMDVQTSPTVEIPAPAESPPPVQLPPVTGKKRSRQTTPRQPVLVAAACGAAALVIVALIAWFASSNKQEQLADAKPTPLPVQSVNPPKQPAPVAPSLNQDPEPVKPPDPQPAEQKPEPDPVPTPANVPATAPPPAPPPATPPSQETTPKPPPKPPAKPAQPPPMPLLPDDWAERTAASEEIWKSLARSRGSARHVLAGEFVAFQEGNPPLVHLRFDQTEATFQGPFSSEGHAFLRQLQLQDAVQLGVRGQSTKSGNDRATLLWMARAGLQEFPRVPFQASGAPRTITPGGLQQSLHSVVWSPDSKKLLVCSKPALLVNAETGEVLQRISNEDGLQGAWSSDGRYIALQVDSIPLPAGAGQNQGGGGLGGGLGGFVPPTFDRGGLVIYDTVSRRQVHAVRSSADGESLFGFRPKGNVLAAVHDAPTTNVFATGSKVVMQYNFAGGKWQSQLVEQFFGTAKLAWKQDGSQLAWAIQGNQSSVKVLGAGSRGQALQVPLNIIITDLTWVPGSKLLAVVGENWLHVSDVLSAKKDGSGFKLNGVNSLKQCSFNSGGRLAAVLRNQGLEVFRLTDETAPLWSPGTNSWQAVAWSPADAVLAAMNSSGAVTLWDEDGQPIAALSSAITASSQAEIAWSPSGQQIAVCGQNNSFVIFDISQF